MRFLTKVLGVALVLMLVAAIIPGITLTSTVAAIVAAVVLSVLNAFVRPVLVFLTLPVTILTLGLFLLIINTVMFSLAAWLVSGFVVEGFLPALLGAMIVSITSYWINRWV